EDETGTPRAQSRRCADDDGPSVDAHRHGEGPRVHRVLVPDAVLLAVDLVGVAQLVVAGRQAREGLELVEAPLLAGRELPPGDLGEFLHRLAAAVDAVLVGELR